MTPRRWMLPIALSAALLAGCREQESGPLLVSVIGPSPRLLNPNLKPLDPPSSTLLEAAAQGLVRFDATGQVEPALAQSWILSDDGLRYTFRLARATWPDGGRVTAEQVAARLRAALSRSSKNPLKPLLGVIAEVEAMTETVLEITLKAPRPNLLQLLAQPELGILRNDQGTGPYKPVPDGESGAVRLSLPVTEEEEEQQSGQPDILLRGEGAAMAVARFQRRLADLVTGGTAGDLPIVRAAAPPAASLRFDPVAGLFGLAFARNDGVLADPEVRRALSMAIDRDAMAASLAVPDLAPRLSLVGPGLEELPSPALPDWAASPLPMRRALAAQALAGRGEDERIGVRVAMPEGPGYRLVFAHLRRDWRAIGVSAEAVRPGAEADLILVDMVAAANLSTWYLRRFSCQASAICSAEADAALDAARTAASPAERQALLISADRSLNGVTPFIPLMSPVRWSLVSPRLTGFQTNVFGRHFVGGLIADRR